jgi:methionyl aminopeptidase
LSEKIIYKTNEEIELIRKSSLLVSDTLAHVASILKSGITTEFIDKSIFDYISSFDGYPIFKGYHGFPASACISVNEEVVHGLPGKRVIKDGDIISVDVGVLKNEFIGDSAYTFAIGDVNKDTLLLLRTTKESLFKGISEAKVNNRIGDISFAVQEYCVAKGYGIVTELVGHGVGRELHEEPQVPNTGRKGSGKKILEGLVIAIEPMINMGKKDVKVLSDDWTYVTKDGKPSAHYEHTIAIRKNGPDILSSFDAIEREERNNINLNSSYY